MSLSAIRTTDLGKKFSRTLRQMMLYGASDIAASILGRMPPADRLRTGEFWAVDGVSFELNRGDSLGIIGPNGSGKTTLLRMLSGIFLPDRGSAEVNGKVGGLIHVGAGFHPMLTGRENIYVNGAILGMTKKEIDRKFDAIVDFADIGAFLDSPVKQYSSGMYVRLGFAVAVHSDPEILLVDEVLAVGDRDFSLKCYARMKEIREAGTTIVLVSHSEYVIRERTRQTLYLRDGKTRFFGSSDEAISLYIQDTLEAKAARLKAVPHEADAQSQKKAEITSLVFHGKDGRVVHGITSGEPLWAQLELRVHDAVACPVVSVNFYNDSGLVYAANSAYEGRELPPLMPGNCRVELFFPAFHLPTETYLCSPALSENNAADLIDVRHMASSLVVGRPPNARGALKLPVEWNVIKG